VVVSRSPDLESTLHAPLSLTGTFALGGTVAADRDAEARDEVLRLFDESAPGLRRYVVSLGLDAASADDVVQEVFLALFRHVRLGRSRANLRGWIFQVGHNLALKQRQNARRRLSAESPADTADTLADPADNPEEQLASDQRQRRLRSVLRALPQRDRRCLHLRAEGLRYREIARILGISLGSVAKSIARALARLTHADIG